MTLFVLVLTVSKTLLSEGGAILSSDKKFIDGVEDIRLLGMKKILK